MEILINWDSKNFAYIKLNYSNYKPKAVDMRDMATSSFSYNCAAADSDTDTNLELWDAQRLHHTRKMRKTLTHAVGSNDITLHARFVANAAIISAATRLDLNRLECCGKCEWAQDDQCKMAATSARTNGSQATYLCVCVAIVKQRLLPFGPHTHRQSHSHLAVVQEAHNKFVEYSQQKASTRWMYKICAAYLAAFLVCFFSFSLTAGDSN